MTLTVAYRGEGVSAGHIDPRILAPAMLGTAELIHDSAREVYGPDLRLNVDVTTNFRQGSFQYDFAASVLPAILPLVATGFSFDALLKLLGIGEGHGLIQLLRWRFQHPPERAAAAGDGQVTITARDGNTITVNRNVYSLSLNPTVISDLREAMMPLIRDGIDEVAIGRDGDTQTFARREDAPIFDAQVPVEEVLEESDEEEILSVEMAPMTPNLMWWFRTPDGKRIRNRIDDPGFWSDFNRHRFAFAPGDAIRILVHRKVGRDRHGQLIVERTDFRFKGYLPAPKQLNLLEPSDDA